MQVRLIKDNKVIYHTLEGGYLRLGVTAVMFICTLVLAYLFVALFQSYKPTDSLLPYLMIAIVLVVAGTAVTVFVMKLLFWRDQLDINLDNVPSDAMITYNTHKTPEAKNYLFPRYDTLLYLSWLHKQLTLTKSEFELLQKLLPKVNYSEVGDPSLVPHG